MNLDHHITINAEAMKSPNLCSHWSDEDLDRIGTEVFEGYEMDEGSRSSWKARSQAAMDLALQIQKDKNFPWPNCSNVAFPLITIAVMQFHARAYPAIISGHEIVKCRVIGEDKDGQARIRSDRISTHMSYQVLEEDLAWEEQHDRLLINIAVVGCAFVKSYWDARMGHNTSELVTANDLVVNYWAKSIETAPRKTQVILMSRNEVHARVLRGAFKDVLNEPWYQTGTVTQAPGQVKIDKRIGISQPKTDNKTPLRLLEQHVDLDLDGDGYAEPYIITIDSESKKVLRIVTRFDREEDIERVQSGKRKGSIISIRPMEYFTKYSFIPSPDGGIYDIGFGILTGPLNESVNSLVNQLIDAGTMANGGGGFLGRGAKIRGGAYTFAPFEWKRVDSTGDDLHKSIVPLQVREPSGVLLQLLSLLINYTNRISGSSDMMAGENPGQNTPAQTSQTMVEQGTKIYSAIFKRIWRSMREEFKKLYILNSIYLPTKVTYGESGAFALREDYLGDPSTVVPVADPHIASEQERMNQVMMLKQAAHTTPGYDLQAVEHRFLKALHVDGIAQIFPGADKVPPLPNPKMQVEQAKLEGKKLDLQAKQMQFVQKLEEEKKLNDAKIVELHARAAKEIEEAGAANAGTHVAAFEAALASMVAHSEHLDRERKSTLEEMKHESEQRNAQAGGGSGMAESSGN